MSRKQPLTAFSTTKAEYIAAADAAKQVIWLWHFLYAIYKHRVYNNSPTKLQMSPKKPTELGIDNQGTLAIATNPIMYSQSKHIRMHYHAICNFIQHGNIEAKYVPTKDMLADGLTKAVPMAILRWLVESLHLNE
jgi:hypothetical protein